MYFKILKLSALAKLNLTRKQCIVLVSLPVGCVLFHTVWRSQVQREEQWNCVKCNSLLASALNCAKSLPAQGRESPGASAS